MCSCSSPSSLCPVSSLTCDPLLTCYFSSLYKTHPYMCFILQSDYWLGYLTLLHTCLLFIAQWALARFLSYSLPLWLPPSTLSSNLNFHLLTLTSTLQILVTHSSNTFDTSDFQKYLGPVVYCACNIYIEAAVLVLTSVKPVSHMEVWLGTQAKAKVQNGGLDSTS